MGKHSAYRESKIRERARALADEEGISFEVSLAVVRERRAATMKALQLSGKKQAVFVDGGPATPFTRLKENSLGCSWPLQGGSPGQGKKS